MKSQAEQAEALAAITRRYADLPALYWSIKPFSELSATPVGEDLPDQIEEWAHVFGGTVTHQEVGDGVTEVSSQLRYGDVPFEIKTYIQETA